MKPRDRKPVSGDEKASINNDDNLDLRPDIPPALTFSRLDRSGQDEIQLEVADYIESMCVDLQVMARAVELNALAYFLDMARLEASIQGESRRKSEP